MFSTVMLQVSPKIEEMISPNFHWKMWSLIIQIDSSIYFDPNKIISNSDILI